MNKIKVIKFFYEEIVPAIGKKAVPKAANRSGSLFSTQARRIYSAAASQGAGAAAREEAVVTEHGLSEIMTGCKPAEISQTPVYSPIIKKDPFAGFHLADETDDLAAATTKCLRPQEAARNGIRYKNYNIKPQLSRMEQTLEGLKMPQGAVSKKIAPDGKGNTIVRFFAPNGLTVRKVTVDRYGYVTEYSNFRTFATNKGLKGDGRLSEKSGSSNHSMLLHDNLEQKIQGEIDETASRYTRMHEETRYILDSRGNPIRSMQRRTYTPHEYGKIGTEPVTTIVDTRTLSHGDITDGGRFVTDVTVEKGGKRFQRSFWFDQKTGERMFTMDGWTKGLTKEEQELLESDPYLASRFYNDPLDFMRVEKFNSYKAQGLRDKTTPLRFHSPTGSEDGYYSYSTIGSNYINTTPRCVRAENKPRMVNILNHEPRHGNQHQMVEDLNTGKLQGAEKEQAQRFEHEFDNYINWDENFNGYWNQEIEKDARRAGEAAKKQYENLGEKEDNIFFAA